MNNNGERKEGRKGNAAVEIQGCAHELVLLATRYHTRTVAILENYTHLHLELHYSVCICKSDRILVANVALMTGVSWCRMVRLHRHYGLSVV